MPGLPSTWLIGAIVICLGLFGATVTTWHMTKVSGARNEGIAIGTGNAATATLEAATKTAEAERVAEASTPLTAERAELIRVCNKSASCRDRGKFK